jgi:hypothetical protein
VRRWPAGNVLSAEAAESPLLEAVSGKRLKTLKAGEDLACALVICTRVRACVRVCVWISDSVLITCSYEWCL